MSLQLVQLDEKVLRLLIPKHRYIAYNARPTLYKYRENGIPLMILNWATPFYSGFNHDAYSSCWSSVLARRGPRESLSSEGRQWRGRRNLRSREGRAPQTQRNKLQG